MNRRSLLGLIVAAPWVITRAGVLMPVRSLVVVSDREWLEVEIERGIRRLLDLPVQSIHATRRLPYTTQPQHVSFHSRLMGPMEFVVKSI